MKIFWIVLGCLALALATYSLTMYFVQRRRQGRAERDGVVVYATVVSVEALKGLAKQVNMKKFTLAIQEPGSTHPRNVELRTRVQQGQAIGPGQRLIVVVDPTEPKRIYPAGAEAAKRVVMTGTRQERRAMNSQMRNPRVPQRPPSGYQPPTSRIR